MDVDNEYIKFMYNASYGGFSFSKKAMAMYHEATGNHSIVSRKDEIMINIVEQLKNKANGPHAKIKIVNVPIKFENCIVCDEHDGYETVSVDYSLYKLTKIRGIINQQDVSDSDKLNTIKGILEESFTNESCDQQSQHALTDESSSSDTERDECLLAT